MSYDFSGHFFSIFIKFSPFYDIIIITSDVKKRLTENNNR